MYLIISRNWGIFTSDDRIFFLNHVTERVWHTKSSEQVIFLLRMLNGRRTFDEIIKEFERKYPSVSKKDILEVLDDLTKRGIVRIVPNGSAKLPREYLIKYNHQIHFFEQFERQGMARYEFQQRLRKSKVLVVGLGGVGSWLVFTVAAAGVGNITGVDGDLVKKRNLGRQILFNEKQVGLPKVKAAEETLANFNQEIQFVGIKKYIKSAHDLVELLEGHDFAVIAGENPPIVIHRWANEASFKTGTPTLPVRGNWIGPLIVPGKTSCNNCYELYFKSYGEEMNKLYSSISAYVPRQQDSLGRRLIGSFLHPLVAVVGTLTAVSCVQHLSGYTEPLTYNRLLIVDQVSLLPRSVDIPRRGNCTFCQ